MSANGQSMAAPHLRAFGENRNRFPPEELFSYAGQHVAWSPDGTRIVASAEHRATLCRRLADAGIPPTRSCLTTSMRPARHSSDEFPLSAGSPMSDNGQYR